MPIRRRLALSATLLTLLLTVTGSVLFSYLLGRNLLTSTDATLRARAEPLIAIITETTSGQPDFPDPASAAALPRLAQVFAPDGALAFSSPPGLMPLADARSSASAGYVNRNVAGETYRLLAEPAAGTSGTWTVIVGGSLMPREQALNRVRFELLVASGATVVLATVGAWLLAGAALRPVERMRRSAASISAHRDDELLTVPGGADELAALGLTLNDMLSRLRLSLQRQRQFVADAGHELRTPLAVLRTELELAARPGRTRPELRSAITAAAEETDRLARLAEALLLLAGREEGGPALTRRSHPLDPLLDQATASWRRRAGEAGVTIDVEAGKGPVVVDADRLRQALDNLFDNALRATPAGGRITVVAATEGRMLRVEVRDTGSGFPPDFLPNAFERFSRPDRARSDGPGGAGLGLAIVAAIAEAHGGRAELCNVAGSGAAVTLLLPQPPLA